MLTEDGGKSPLAEWINKQAKIYQQSNIASLESFLIRPIQRILKYPLLLSQIKTLCPKESPQYFKINEALRAIESGKLNLIFLFALHFLITIFFQLRSTLMRCKG